jgi:hypothetical protein
VRNVTDATFIARHHCIQVYDWDMEEEEEGSL